MEQLFACIDPNSPRTQQDWISMNLTGACALHTTSNIIPQNVWSCVTDISTVTFQISICMGYHFIRNNLHRATTAKQIYQCFVWLSLPRNHECRHCVSQWQGSWTLSGAERTPLPGDWTRRNQSETEAQSNRKYPIFFRRVTSTTPSGYAFPSEFS